MTILGLFDRPLPKSAAKLLLIMQVGNPNFWVALNGVAHEGQRPLYGAMRRVHFQRQFDMRKSRIFQVVGIDVHLEEGLCRESDVQEDAQFS